MTIVFYTASAVAIIATILMLTRANAVHALLDLIVSLLAVAVIFFVLGAPFVAALEVIIYAGAIMVLFLFTVMLLNVPREDAAEWDRAHPYYRPWALRVGTALAVVMALQLGWALSRTPGLGAGVADERPAVSSVAELGRVLFTDYMFAFEVTSILIIIAMVGAVALARKRES